MMKAVQATMALLCILVLAGCGGGPVISELQITPHTTISPNADRLDDVTQISYRVGQPATVSLRFTAADGTTYTLREEVRRAPGEYELLFSGVVEGRVLPDGDYTVRLSATPLQGGTPAELTTPLTIVQADTTAPQILNLSVTPNRLSPNSDGVADVATISYSLSKEMSSVLPYLIGPDGDWYPIPADDLREPTAAGSHTHLFDGDVGLGALPPPDGDYTLYVEAIDAVGAKSVVSTTLTLNNGGVPLAQITRNDVQFSTEVLVLGDTLTFTTTVTNTGNAPIRTHGPEPGTVYDSSQNYNNFDAPISDGAWRLGLDFDGNPVYNGRRYPYRWQLGRSEELTEIDGELYLMPGQEVMVTGGLRLLAMPPREKPGFWIGLDHENVRFVEDFVGTTYITVEGRPDAPQILGTPATP